MNVYLNGQYLPLEEARISVLDRGFLFGDGVYEVVPVYRRRPLAWEQHWQRLTHSLRGIRLANPLAPSEAAAVLARLVADMEEQDSSFYLQITRGVASRDHGFPQATSATVLAYAKPMSPPPAIWLHEGVSAVTRVDDRWLHCDLKTTALLANVLLRQQALDDGAVEAVLLRAGKVTEGAASNVLLVMKGVLVSPPRNHLMLAGITLALVMELAQRLSIPWVEREIDEQELRQADEIWLTSSTRELLPVTRLDGQLVGSGLPGAIGQRLLAAYQALK